MWLCARDDQLVPPDSLLDEGVPELEAGSESEPGLVTEPAVEDETPPAAPPPPAEAPIETTVGRALFNDVLAPEIRFVYVAQEKGTLKRLLGMAYTLLGQEETAAMADRIKDIGFHYATRSGTSIAVTDLIVPAKKQVILADAADQVNEMERQYRRGLLTEGVQNPITILSLLGREATQRYLLQEVQKVYRSGSRRRIKIGLPSARLAPSVPP